MAGPSKFLLQGLIELANRGQGWVDVYEAPDGQIHCELDPSEYLLAALMFADQGDPSALQRLFIQYGFGPAAAREAAPDDA